MKPRAAVSGCLIGGTLVAVGCGGTVSSEQAEESATVVSPCTTEEKPPSAATRLFAPSPNPAAIDQIKSLVRHKRLLDAARLAKLVSIPRAVWLVGGSPSEVKKTVRTTMRQARLQRSVPVLVAYNLPYRDCSQYSSGGAVDTAEYQAWLDGLAAGIKNDRAIVILEPDGLGIIPYNTTIYGEQEWCKPTVTDEAGNTVPAPGASPEERYASLRYAVATLAAKAPNAQVYLDGSHSNWLGVGEAAYRIYQAGAVDGALNVRGFFLNVSNYRETSQLIRFGTWVSKCLAAATTGADWARGHFDWCPSQYNPGAGYTVDYSDAYAATVDASLENMMQGAEPTAHFVIDTGRNGRGPLDTSLYGAPPYNQPVSVLTALGNGSWCNARGAGAGPRPSLNTGVGLLDAYLWLKVAGESDGSCNAAGGARAWDWMAYNPWAVSEEEQSEFDPLWGMVDPAAGQWFPEQALELARKAQPPLF